MSVARSGTSVTLVSHDGTWISQRVFVATTFSERRAGTKGGHRSILLRTTSVHGRGLSEPLDLVGIDATGRVVESRRLWPGRFARLPDASWILEQPIELPLPEVGSSLALYARYVTGRLSLCATPIGNLSDASDRLRIVLDDADLIYAEDTRRAAKLLQALDVRTSVRSYFVGNERQRSEELRARLVAGEHIALITDAGMPSISDPGLTAVRTAIEVDAEVTIVPGPSAVTSALAVSGLPADRFTFEGFLPRKGSERGRRIAELAVEKRTAVLFSAKTRVADDLADLAAGLGDDRQVVVTRELTKVFEEVWRGSLGEAAAHWEEQVRRGEFTLVVAGAVEENTDLDRIVAKAIDAIESGESMADAVRRIASESGISRRDLYQAVLNEQP